MPKKVHGRPAKGKPRARRTSRPAQPVGAEPVEGTAPAALATPPPPPTARAVPPPSTTARRSATSVRRAPGITVNYHYLRHDVLTLGVLAPLMVVLLIVAFVFLH